MNQMIILIIYQKNILKENLAEKDITAKDNDAQKGFYQKNKFFYL